MAAYNRLAKHQEGDRGMAARRSSKPLAEPAGEAGGEGVDILRLARERIPGARDEIEREGGMIVECQDHTLSLLEEACDEIERLRNVLGASSG